ncbi:MAG: barnase inhibitor [Ruminococcaceae bacterium]|nr:barnase inhibitor [Oscillospiraceae bacterium]
MYKFKDLYILDFSKIEHYTEIHNIIKKELDFPDYYGCNWDAFWDCLTDMVGRPVNIRIIGVENIENIFGSDESDMLIDTLKEFKHYRNDKYSDQINIEIIKNGNAFIL